LYNSAKGVGCNFYVAICICLFPIYQLMNPSMHLPNSHFIDAILSKIVKLSCIPRRNVGL